MTCARRRTAPRGSARGPVGFVAVLALSCPHPESPQQPIAAVAELWPGAAAARSWGGRTWAAPPTSPRSRPRDRAGWPVLQPRHRRDGVTDRIDQCRRSPPVRAPDAAARVPSAEGVLCHAAGRSLRCHRRGGHDPRWDLRSLPSFDWPTCGTRPRRSPASSFSRYLTSRTPSARKLKGVADLQRR